MHEARTAPPGTPGGIGRIAAFYRAMIRFLAGSSMAALVALVFAQVVVRYVFDSSLIWAEELARYVLIWQAFLLIGTAYQQGELVAVEALPKLLGPRQRFALRLILAGPILWFLYVMVTNGYTYAWRFESQIIPAFDFIWTALTGGPIGVPISWVYISVSVGSSLLALHIIVSLIAEASALARAVSDRTETHADTHGDAR